MDISSWISEADDSDLVKKTLKIWFTLCKSYNQQPWCRFPSVLDTDEFYPNAKVVLLTEAQMLCKPSPNSMITFV